MKRLIEKYFICCNILYCIALYSSIIFEINRVLCTMKGLTLHYITLHYITLHYITYITLQDIILDYIILHYITILYYIKPFIIYHIIFNYIILLLTVASPFRLGPYSACVRVGPRMEFRSFLLVRVPCLSFLGYQSV